MLRMLNNLKKNGILELEVEKKDAELKKSKDAKKKRGGIPQAAEKTNRQKRHYQQDKHTNFHQAIKFFTLLGKKCERNDRYPYCGWRVTNLKSDTAFSSVAVIAAFTTPTIVIPYTTILLLTALRPIQMT